jgi:hypothetical protein
MQTSVTAKLANGVVGEIFDDVPHIVDSYILDGATNVGTAMTVSAEGVVVKGTDAGIFGGILCNPKQYANFNISLGASNEVADGTQVSVLKKGRIWVDLGGTASIGDGVYYVDDTGVLGAGTAATGQTQITGAEVVLYDAAANGLAVIELS